MTVLGRDRARVSLVSAGLALAGAQPASGIKTPAEAVAALERGEIAHFVLIEGALTPSVLDPLRANPRLAERVTLLLPEGDAPTTRRAEIKVLPASSTLEDIRRAVLGGAEGPSTPEVFEADATDAPILPLLGAALNLAPTMKLWFDDGERAMGLCLVEGRVRAMGRSGERLDSVPALHEDKSLGLVLGLWREQGAESDAAAGLHGDLELVCEYGELFARSEAYRAYEAELMCALLTFEPKIVRFAAHTPASVGTDLASLLRVGLESLDLDTLRAYAGGGGAALMAPHGLPEALRPALPPRRYGRLFFILEDGATLETALRTASRLEEREALAAVVLAIAAGAVREVELDRVPRPEPAPRSAAAAAPEAHDDGLPPIGKPPAWLGPAPEPRPGPAPEPAPAPLGSPSPAVPPPLPPEAGRAHTPALGTPRPDVAAEAVRPRSPNTRRRGGRRFVKTLQGLGPSNLDDALCGDPRHFLETLREAHATSRQTGKRIRLRNTRFEPVGEVRANLALFYRIGAGGMGEVFLGVRGSHASFQKVVAVKRMTEALTGDAQRLDMFLTEARLSATLQHPNIVQIFQLLRFGGDYLLIMEFVHGVAVSELIKRLAKAGRAASPELVRHVGAEAARALDYAHHLTDDEGGPMGLVHRDVAPDNILVGFDGSVKLIDFGIARAKTDRFSVVGEGARSGRLRYMAPEMLAGEAVGPHSDQFSLAVALYKMLTGKNPHGQGATDETIAAIVNGDHAPLVELRRDVPPRMAYAIERAMSPQPRDRFEDCNAFRSALLAGAPGDFDATSQLVLNLDEVLGPQRRHEMEAIARMRRAAAAVLRPDSRKVTRPKLAAIRSGGSE